MLANAVVLPLSYSVTVELASALPLKVGVAALVLSSLFELPLSEAVARSRAVGAAGAEVSTVTVSAVDATLVLPARSVALAVMTWLPLLKVGLVRLQAPLVSADTLANAVVLPLSYSATVELASALPLKVGVAALVVLSVFELPLSEVVARSRAVGAAGVEVSTVTVKADEAAPVLPARSVAVAVML